jgi:arginyl-tRNA--protein-N-Asp/Glu arginylyltransferase
MAYKINFQPLEGLIDGQWRRLPRDASSPEAA